MKDLIAIGEAQKKTTPTSTANASSSASAGDPSGKAAGRGPRLRGGKGSAETAADAAGADK